MSLQILHGAFIRYNAKVSASETISWAAGRVLTLDSSAEARVSTTGVTEIIGIGVDKRVPSTQYSSTASSQAGVPSGEQAAMILDDAVLIDDQVSGNSQWGVGDAVYVDALGRLTTANTRNRVIGKALAVNLVGGALRFLFTVQY
jgi:hypothetical protein